MASPQPTTRQWEKLTDGTIWENLRTAASETTQTWKLIKTIENYILVHKPAVLKFSIATLTSVSRQSTAILSLVQPQAWQIILLSHPSVPNITLILHLWIADKIQEVY